MVSNENVTHSRVYGTFHEKRDILELHVKGKKNYDFRRKNKVYKYARSFQKCSATNHGMSHMVT